MDLLALVFVWLQGSMGSQQPARFGACQPEWLPTFGTAIGTSRQIHSLAVLDDGDGPALFVGGEFERAGSVLANGVAKWDGGRWSQFGGGFLGLDVHLPARVNALAVFDGGSGPELYAGGWLGGEGSEAIWAASWDGARWKSLGLNGEVRAFLVFDDGTGQALYAGGEFTGTEFGDDVAYVARWDGSHWTALGSGMDSVVTVLAAFDDGRGPALYAGGQFDTAGGVAVNHIARWDGTAWSALGSGTSSSVDALTVFDDGSGPALHVGGRFRTAGGATANRIAKWDGTHWSALGSGMNNAVDAVSVYDDGTGPALFAAGAFTIAGGLPASYVARWNGSSWSALGSGTSWTVDALAVFDDGSGPKLYVGGGFELADGEEVSHLAAWDGSGWTSVGGSPFGHDGPVRIADLAVLDDAGGNGRELYAAGFFTGADWGPNVARWDGRAWTLLGTAADNYIHALAVFDAGDGPRLHAAGEFTSIGGASARGIARWDGSGWAPLGSGVDGDVFTLTVFDDGGGVALYAGGSFAEAGGVPALRIARWDGASWAPLAGGTDFGVVDLVVFDDGGGDALYAGGVSLAPRENALGRIARWDGAAWSALGTGIGDEDALVLALEVFDDGSGTALFAGGRFTDAGGAAVSNLARWDGAAWSDVGAGMTAAEDSEVRDLRVFDDGRGAALYAGGLFTSAGGVPAAHIARWDGSSWAPLGRGISDPPEVFLPWSYAPVLTLEVHTGSNGNLALYAGGRFFGALDSGDSYLARWQGCLDVTAPAIRPLPDLVVREVAGSRAGEVVTFDVTATDNQDTFVPVTCTPPSGSLFPPGVTQVSCQATDAAGNTARRSFRVIVTGRTR